MYQTVIIGAFLLIYFSKPSSSHYDLELNKTFVKDIEIDILKAWKEQKINADRLVPMGDGNSKKVDGYFQQHIFKKSVPEKEENLLTGFGVVHYFQLLFMLDQPEENLSIVTSICHGKNIDPSAQTSANLAKYKLFASKPRDPRKLSNDVNTAAKYFFNMVKKSFTASDSYMLSEVGLLYDPSEYVLEVDGVDYIGEGELPVPFLQFALVFMANEKSPPVPAGLPNSNKIAQMVSVTTSKAIVTEKEPEAGFTIEKVTNEDVQKSTEKKGMLQRLGWNKKNEK